MTTRLELVAPELVQGLAEASLTHLRRVAAAVSVAAAERLGLAEERLEAARGALTRGEVGDSPARAALRTLVEELDETQWTLQGH